MNRRVLLTIAASITVAVGPAVTIASPAVAAPNTAAPASAASVSAPSLMLPLAAKYKFANCTALHKVYPHGVGKSNARDKVRGKTKPVTNFTRSTSLYKKIVGYKHDLDRDKDGVACEKR
jgi:Excalibur calcium-binding domain.